MKPTSNQNDVTNKQVRGSAVMLVGRLLALFINLFVQILIVRYLSKHDYGAFAFAIAMAALATNISLLGLDKALARFMAIYHESQDMKRMAGTAMMILFTVSGVGLAIVLGVIGFQHLLGKYVVSNSLSLAMLLTLIALAPIDSINAVMQSIFGVFGEVRTVFVRRYLLGPLLKLIAIIGVMVFQGSVQTLAVCYLVAATLGVILYLAMLVKILKREQLTKWFRPEHWKFPAREIFGFSIPLLTNQFSFLSRTAIIVILLEAIQGTVAVADFRSVTPFARLNLVVITSFTFLFTPLASRMFAQKDAGTINNLYWTSASWVLVLTFPAILLTGIFSPQLTQLIFDQRYESSSAILALLSIGFFFEAAFGFTVQTLRVHAKVRQIVAVDLIALLIAIGLYVALIPRFGAIGAAWGAMFAMTFQNLAYFVVMRLTTGYGKLEWKHAKTYLYSISLAAVVLIVQLLLMPNIVVAVCLIVLATVVLLVALRDTLQTDRFFPELLKIPFLGKWLATGSSMSAASEATP